MPTFSVVIPTFNRAEKLKETIASVLSQTNGDFEILVMDDGSQDHTQEAVESFKDSRIRYEWAANSGGPATPRNRGIDLARGEWISFLDSDDLWLPRKLEILKAEIAKDSSVDVFCHAEEVLYRETQECIKSVYGPFEDDFYKVMLTQGNRCSTSATTVRKSFLEEHNLRFNTSKEYVIVEDYDLWLFLALHNARFKFLDTVLGRYIIEHDNISLSSEKMLHNLETVLRAHVFMHQRFESNRELLWRIVSMQVRFPRVKHLLTEKKAVQALRELSSAAREAPFEATTYFFRRTFGCMGRKFADHLFNHRSAKQ